MCMGMGFPMGMGIPWESIPWESHGNGNETRNWGWEWEGMGNHVNGNWNYPHSHGNLFPQILLLRSRLDQLVAVSSQQYEVKT